jgi:hypothetical protein
MGTFRRILTIHNLARVSGVRYSFEMDVETMGDAALIAGGFTARCASGTLDYRNHVRACDFREELDLHNAGL